MNILKHFDKLIAVSFAFVMGVAVSAGNAPVYNVTPYEPQNIQPPSNYDQYPQPMPNSPYNNQQPPIGPNQKHCMPKSQMGQEHLQQMKHNKVKKQPAIKKTKIDEQRHSD
jgi:hypothetical protein